MTEKRYSVWWDEETALMQGPQYETWEGANKMARVVMQEGDEYRIWRYNDDGTVTDVTDGEPEEKMWYCKWSPDNGYGTPFVSRVDEPRASITFEGRELEDAEAHIRSATAPTPEQFQAHVLAETGVEVPCVPEKAKWWDWHGLTDAWAECRADSPTVEFDQCADGTVWGVTVCGTVSNRDEKRDALLAAAKAAGKPEDES